MSIKRTSRRHTSGISQEVDESYWLFKPGQRVMTSDGIPGTVTEVQDGPFSGDEQYLVTLDNDLGGGEYDSSDLSDLPTTTAAVIQPGQRVLQTEAVGDEVVTAASDYPELAEILVQRPPLAHAEPLVMRASKTASETEAAKTDWAALHAYFVCDCGYQGTLAPTTLSDGSKVDVCPACGATSPYEEIDADGWALDDPMRPENLTRAASADKKMSPEQAADEHVFFATAGLFDRVLETGADVLNSQMKPQHQLQPGTSRTYDWCRFRKNERCMFPKHLDVEGTKQAGYAVFIPEDRGLCPRNAWDQQQTCPVAEPGPNSGDPHARVDATVPWSEGGQHGGMPAHAALLKEAGFEVAASWADVRTKAQRIRAEGGVRIISAPREGDDSLTVTAEIKGDQNTYETTLLREPGRHNVASWRCGCAWAAYSWGRRGRFQRFEGRMCSHALALQYEAQSRGMFGKTIVEDAKVPPWRVGNDPFHYEKPPRAGDHTRAASLVAKGSVDHPVYDDALFADAPITLIAADDGLSVTASGEVMDFGGRLKALVNGVVQHIFHITDRDAVTGSGAMVPVDQVLYPTYSPTRGLTLTVTADLHDEPEPALPQTEGEDDLEQIHSEALVVEALVDPATAPEMAEVVAETLTSSPPSPGDPRLAWLMSGPSDGATGESAGGGSPQTASDSDIAVQAKAFLAKQALKAFSPEEQKAIIEEGLDVQAANLGDLDLEGTHYLGLEAAFRQEEGEDEL